MRPATIVTDEIEVDRRLAQQFGTTRADWIGVTHAVVLARNDTTPFDPASAPGQFAYIFGTRAVRTLLLSKGYEIQREDNVEITFSDGRGVKVIYQNVDAAADPAHSPKAISSKGPASGRIIERSMGYLFPEWEEEEQAAIRELMRREAAETWYFSVSVDGNDVRAELSRPYPLVDGQFSGFIERIFILKPGEWAEFGSVEFDDGAPGQDFEIEVTRR